MNDIVRIIVVYFATLFFIVWCFLSIYPMAFALDYLYNISEFLTFLFFILFIPIQFVISVIFPLFIFEKVLK